MSILLTANANIPLRYWDFMTESDWLFLLTCAKVGKGIEQYHINHLTLNYLYRAPKTTAERIAQGLEDLAVSYREGEPWPGTIDQEKFIENEHLFYRFSKWTRASLGFSLINSAHLSHEAISSIPLEGNT